MQWALPRLEKRWAGFRKPRGQVKKRLRDRLSALGVESLEAYRHRLEVDPEEWHTLDFITRVTISRFHRNPRAWEFLRQVVLPDLSSRARDAGRSRLRAYSAGCASGEEPYTLRILWDLEPADPTLDLEIVAVDLDPHLIERARAGRYPTSSIEPLPEPWRRAAFEREDGALVLRPEHRRVDFEVADVTRHVPPGPFDLVLCSYTVFIYCEPSKAERFVRHLARRVVAGAALMVGPHERPPESTRDDPLEAWDPNEDVFRFR